MNTTSKFVVLSALAALMIAGTMAVALSDDANAIRINRNNLNLAGAVNGQNSGDTASAVGGNVGGDNIVAGGNACSQCNAQDGDDNTNNGQNNPP